MLTQLCIQVLIFVNSGEIGIKMRKSPSSHGRVQGRWALIPGRQSGRAQEVITPPYRSASARANLRP